MTVDGAVTGVAVAWTPVTYSATFTETGLPSGTSWSATLGGTVESSTTSTITLTEPNGTYSYSVGAVPGWTTPSYSGSVIVNGTAADIPVPWTQVTYTIAFAETGLPAGAEWYVNTTNGRSFTSTTDGLTFAEPNGTYPFTVATGADYVATLSSGTLVVAGVSVNESITFTRTYGIMFNRPPGSAAGTSWTVYLNATTVSDAYRAEGILPNDIVRNTTTNLLTIYAPNGTYGYSIIVSGNPSLTTRGTVTVDGSGVVANPPSTPGTVLQGSPA